MLSIEHGDSNEILSAMAEDGRLFDVCITDAPYHYESIVRRFGRNQAAARFGKDGRFARASEKFRGMSWDAEESGYRIAFDPGFWRRVYAVLKPGAFCLAFGSPSTGHWQAAAMDEAGFTMHPFIGWCYSSGMPKGHAVGDDMPGHYYGTQTLKPALEPIFVGQKPFHKSPARAAIRETGVGAFNIDSCRIASEDNNHKPRYPTSLIIDESDAVRALFPDGAERFFKSFPPVIYHRKANKIDRADSVHPTVKPIGLIRYLIRLCVPQNGSIVDPFAGSGTTGEAALQEGASVTLIERESLYVAGMLRRFSADNSIRKYLEYVENVRAFGRTEFRSQGEGSYRLLG